MDASRTGGAQELAWIARALGVPMVERGARIQSLWGGYGEIYRVQGGGRTAVVKSVRPPAAARSHRGHQRKLRSYEVEHAFYRDYAKRSRAPVAALLDAMRDEERFLFVLEDLDAAGFRGRSRRGDGDRRAFEIDACLAWLAKFHASFLDDAGPVEHPGLWSTGTYWHLETRPDELAAIEDPALRAAAPELDRRLRTARFQTLVHGDAKLENFCFGPSEVAAVDFQYVGGGPGVRDVAYLVSGEPDEERHVDRYFEHLRRETGSLDVEREWRALKPIAAADFYRFLAGWAKAHWANDRHGQRVVHEVIGTL